MSTVTALTKMGVSSANATKFAPALDAAMKEFEINTKNRKAMFLAQIVHESGYLAATKENLNYSADRLLVVFPKYFSSSALANQYGRAPEKIANRVYGNRMGNGNEASGDGFKYRGRGFMQLTGHDNYVACGKGLNVDLTNDPSYLETAEGASRSAAWFWAKNGLNTIADKNDIVAATKRINGGINGLNDRKALYAKALSAV